MHCLRRVEIRFKVDSVYLRHRQIYVTGYEFISTVYGSNTTVELSIKVSERGYEYPGNQVRVEASNTRYSSSIPNSNVPSEY
jgi:hypothetical protein